MSHDSNSFVSITFAPSESIMIVDDTPMSVTWVGSVCIPAMSLTDVYHVSSLMSNLASVSQLCDFGLLVFFSRPSCYVQNPLSKKLIGRGRRQGDSMCWMSWNYLVASSGVDLSSFGMSHSSSKFYLWHSRLGHVSGSRLKYLASTGEFEKLDSHNISYFRDAS